MTTIPGSVPDPFLHHFASQLKPGRVLDCGSGRGRNTLPLADLGFSVCGVDRVGFKLAEAKEASRRSGTRVDWVQAELGCLPFGSGQFVGALCTHVLEELRAPLQEVIAAELWRVLEEGGRLLVITAARGESVPRGGEEVGENAFLFRRRGQESVLHLISQRQLLRWFGAFRVQELVHLRWEQPLLTPINAHWVLLAEKKSLRLPTSHPEGEGHQTEHDASAKAEDHGPGKVHDKAMDPFRSEHFPP